MAKKADDRKAKKDAWRKRKAEASKYGSNREEILQAMQGLNEVETVEFERRLNLHRDQLDQRLKEIDKYRTEIEAYNKRAAEAVRRKNQGLPIDGTLGPPPERDDEPLPDIDFKELAEEIKGQFRDKDGNPVFRFKDLQGLSKEVRDKVLEPIRKTVGLLRPDEVKEFDRRVEEILAQHVEGMDTDLDLGSIAESVRRDLRPQPQRREYRSHERENPEDQSVETYLELVSNCLKYSREAATPEARAECLRNYMVLKEARVFHIGQPTYIAIHQEADRYTTTAAGFEYDEPFSGKPVPHRDNQKYVNFFLREAKYQNLPETFPFPNLFFGYGPGLKLPDHTIDLKSPAKLRENIEELFLLGHVVTRDGLALACLRGLLRNRADDTAYVVWFDEARNEGGGWTRGLDLEPWILPNLIKLINNHRTFVVETELSGQVRKGIKENKKPLGVEDYKFMPRPYYTLRLQSNVIRDTVRKQLGKPPKPKLYKTDVRGHERCRIRRGPIPIDPKLAAKLEKRGYRIFTANQLDQETYERLGERGMAYKRADEWLAVKASWVKDHLSSSNPNLPYIPAVRKLGSVKTAPQKRTGAWSEDPAAR